MKYTQGYNPHPQMSLPMARSVGVESSDEMAVLSVDSAQVKDDNGTMQKEDFLKRLNFELPEGIEVFDAGMILEKKSFCKAENEYLFELKDDFLSGNMEILKHKIENIMLKDEIVLERRIDERNYGHKVEVRKFIKNISIDGNNISACFHHSPEGSIRIEEFMLIMDFNASNLKRPIMRKKTTWIS